ncbi:MAG TPA: class I SAM-dependent methyltransferase, partial [Patescibacteria group bacterium]|nr:class I SAM-dependent methyltransferase [Patescibacteria group bacterium]
MTGVVPVTATEEKRRSGERLFGLSIRLLNLIIRDSRLTVTCRSTGQTMVAGRAKRDGFAITVDEPRTLWKIVTNPDPGAGELFMDHKWEMTGGDIGAFITMMARNLQALLDGPAGFVLAPILRKSLQVRGRGLANSKSYIQHHYDIGNDLYELFLDDGLNYSCAFFENPGMSLRDA